MEEPLDLGDLTVGKKIIAENFANWTSGNKIIDNFIQEKQLKFEGGALFEWIPYNEFIDIKEIGDNCLTTAIYKIGPLNYDINEKEWIKVSYDKVVLRYLYDLQNITDGLINKIESYLGKYFSYGIGISQNPDTKIYILVFNIKYLKRYCVKCGNKHPKKSEKLCFRCKFNLKIDFISRTSGNKKIDAFIQKMQLKINKYNNTMFEWIPYNEFFEIKEVDGKGRFATAIWKEGLLHFDDNENKLIRKSYEKVCLKYLYSHDIINELLREVESSSSYEKYNYGISQNPDTKAYILVFNIGYLDLYCDDCGSKYEGKYDKWCKSCQINYFTNNFANWTSGNEKIDEFIQNKQLKINKYNDTIIEWIPYNELINIKEVDGEGIAIWKKSPLHFNGIKKKVISESYEKVCLKYLHNSQDVTDEFLNEIEKYLANKLVFGISQNPVTKVYNLVLNGRFFDIYCINCSKYCYEKWCKTCQINYLKNNFTHWTSGNEKIDDFIQKMQSKINKYDDTIFEWIPYNEFIDIKKIEKGNFATAIWKDGPLYYSRIRRKYKRILNEKVLLKYLDNSQNINYTFLNKIAYSINESYGISQNPNTKDFIFVLQPRYYCENCGEKYNNKFEVDNKSCASCQTNHENQKINDLIQEMKLSIDHNSNTSNMIFEWIPYDQFNNIEKIGKGGFSTVYSAIWEDGLLIYDGSTWKRKSNTMVALKCIHNSQNFLDEFINEVRAYPNQKIENILKIYGISQNLNTKDYVMVLEYAEGGNFNNYLNRNRENFDWFNGLRVLTNIIEGLNKIHQKQMVHRDFHIGNILFMNDKYYNACISDLGLCRKIDDISDMSIYGVMPYVAPEVLKGKPYTQAADIYSFGMIMYVIATGRQPFADCAHDEILVIHICNGIRPEINDLITPKYYIDLMKRCWDSNPENRPNSIEIKEIIKLFYNSLDQKFKKKEQQHYEIEEQFKETQESRKKHLLSFKNESTTHIQAIYTSRLLNPFTKNLLKYDDNNINNTVEITDFTNL
ncbi:unnamed protein product [Rhizophagus irregularis]|nr:unnamed protein product [Rhizophagus irregularis]